MATLLASHQAHEEYAWRVAWNKKGTQLASCGSDLKVLVWNWNLEDSTLSQPHEIINADSRFAHTRTVRTICWSPNGKYFTMASFDGSISLWEAASWNQYHHVTKLEGHESEVKAVAWSPSGQFIATCGRDKSIWIWNVSDIDDIECAAVLQGHVQDVKHVIWHPKEDILFSSSYDNTIKIWADPGDDEDWVCINTLAGHESTVWEVSFHPDGTQFVSCSSDKTIRIWSLENQTAGKQKWVAKQVLSDVHDREVYSVSWSSTGNRIAAGSRDNSISIFGPSDSLSFVLLTKFEAHGSDVNSVSWNPVDSSVLASNGDDGLLKIWRV